MRTFYIFKIKRDLIYLYKKNPKLLYDLLKKIYNMKNIDLGSDLFYQLCTNIDKNELDRYLFIKLHRKIFYIKQNNDHVINDMYKDEISILNVKHAYIKLEINKTKSYFFKALCSYYQDYFVCDFNSSDYFFLSQIKMLV